MTSNDAPVAFCPAAAFSSQSFLEDGSVGDGLMLVLELRGRQVLQAAVRSNGVVVATPVLDHDLGLGARAEPLDAPALVAQSAFEAVAGSVLPRLAGIVSSSLLRTSIARHRAHRKPVALSSDEGV
jgi:hypothetical protein